MKLLNKYKIISNILLTLSIVFFLVFHITSLIKTGWLADEVFHIRFLNEWFLFNFSDYFFQLQHTVFPPRSPVFGNPPLGMFFMTFAMWLGSFFNINYLISSRVMVFLFGIFSVVLLVLISSAISSKNKKILSILIIILSATFPALIVSNTTAYLDSVSIFFVLLYLYLLILSIEKQKLKYLFVASFFVGVGFIVKYQAAIVILILTVFFFLKIKKLINKKIYYLYFLLLGYLGTAIWVGMRDLNQIFAILKTVTGVSLGRNITTKEGGGLFSDYSNIDTNFFFNFQYYFSQIFFKLSIVIILGLIFFIFYKKYQTEKEGFYLKIFLISSLALPLFFGLIADTPNTIHRVAISFPFIILISSYGYSWFLSSLNNIKKILFLILIILFSTVNMFFLDHTFLNYHKNVLSNIFNQNNYLFRNGDGEGLSLVYDWFKENKNEDKRIGVIRFGFVLVEYMNDSDIVVFPLDEGCHYAFKESIDYVVVHQSHLSGGISPSIIKENCLLLEKTIFNKKEPVIFIYKIQFPQVEIDNIVIEEPIIFKAKSSESYIKLYKQEGYLIENKINEGEWVYLSKKITELGNYKGIYLEVDNYQSLEQNMYIDLVYESGYLRQKVKLNFIGKKRFLSYFEDMLISGSKEFDLNKVNSIKISFDSKINSSNFILLDKFSFFK